MPPNFHGLYAPHYPIPSGVSFRLKQPRKRRYPPDVLKRLAFLSRNPGRRERELYLKWREEEIMKEGKTLDVNKILDDPNRKRLDGDQLTAHLEKQRTWFDERERDIPRLYPNEGEAYPHYMLLAEDKATFDRAAQLQETGQRAAEAEEARDQKDETISPNQREDGVLGESSPQEKAVESK